MRHKPLIFLSLGSARFNAHPVDCDLLFELSSKTLSPIKVKKIIKRKGK